jgi:hypothetical protein
MDKYIYKLSLFSSQDKHAMKEMNKVGWFFSFVKKLPRHQEIIEKKSFGRFPRHQTGQPRDQW